MENQLIEYFMQFGQLTPDEIKVLEDSIEVIELPKGEVLIKEGQKHSKSYFILKGLVRQYKLIDGEELTTRFFKENEWIIVPEFSGSVSKEYLVCLENTNLIWGNEKKALELFQIYPKFENISRAMLERALAEQQEMLSSYITGSPEERYLRLMKTSPDILQRVPQYYIASYIGVKPESLSRIRKRLSDIT